MPARRKVQLERGIATKDFSRSFLRSDKFLLQDPAILRNAARNSLALVSSEKHAAQNPEKQRKKPSLNYKSAALTN